MEDAQRTIPWSDQPAGRGYWIKGDFPLGNSVTSSAQLGRPFILVGSELGEEGNLTWFQIPPTTVNLFGYLLTVSWQLTFMFKIKCLIDYFLEQQWAVVLYINQPISGLSHYWSLSFFLGSFCVCVCVCVCVCACAPEGWESWRKGVFVLKVEESWACIYSPNYTSTRIFQRPRINSQHDSQVQAESQRMGYYADFILSKILA